jgi:hypothetical protein
MNQSNEKEESVLQFYRHEAFALNGCSGHYCDIRHISMYIIAPAGAEYPARSHPDDDT